MKYSEMKYERPDTGKVGTDFIEFIDAFANAKSFEEADEALNKINILRNEVDSMKMMAFIN